MQQSFWSIYILGIFMLGLDSKLVGQAFQPEFAEPLTNLTITVGRDATFRCLVQNLGGYRVGWVKADTKAIQAIHVHVITNNHRVGVSHNGQSVWNLHIKNVQEEDRGQYMCQINTDPMKSQMGYLNVVIPPDFVAEETSGDVMVQEGGTAKVVCRARGIPTPRVMWRREDGVDIVLRDSYGSKSKATMVEEDTLTLSKISRTEMGAYLCIASNGVPPSISKRIIIKVHFHPVIQVPNQLVGAPLGTDVILECYVESSPKSINYWVRDSNLQLSWQQCCIPRMERLTMQLPGRWCSDKDLNRRPIATQSLLPSNGFCCHGDGEMVISSNKYEVTNTAVSSFETKMSLTVKYLTSADVGGYRCVAKNSLGEVDSVIRLYEIPGPAVRNHSQTNKNEELSTIAEETHNKKENRIENEEKSIVISINSSEENLQENEYSDIKNNSLKHIHSLEINNRPKISNKISKILSNLDNIENGFESNVGNGGYCYYLGLTYLISLILLNVQTLQFN